MLEHDQRADRGSNGGDLVILVRDGDPIVGQQLVRHLVQALDERTAERERPVHPRPARIGRRHHQILLDLLLHYLGVDTSRHDPRQHIRDVRNLDRAVEPREEETENGGPPVCRRHLGRTHQTVRVSFGRIADRVSKDLQQPPRLLLVPTPCRQVHRVARMRQVRKRLRAPLVAGKRIHHSLLSLNHGLAKGPRLVLGHVQIRPRLVVQIHLVLLHFQTQHVLHHRRVPTSCSQDKRIPAPGCLLNKLVRHQRLDRRAVPSRTQQVKHKVVLPRQLLQPLGLALVETQVEQDIDHRTVVEKASRHQCLPYPFALPPHHQRGHRLAVALCRSTEKNASDRTARRGRVGQHCVPDRARHVPSSVL